MGACNFATSAYGKSARSAFQSAVADACYEYGHGGYTGTIAEKSTFTVVQMPEGMQPFSAEFHAWVDRLTNCEFDDKWGPAGAVLVGKRGDVEEWYFFGWASE